MGYAIKADGTLDLATPNAPRVRRCCQCGELAICVFRFAGYAYECTNPTCPPQQPVSHVCDTPQVAADCWNWLNGPVSQTSK